MAIQDPNKVHESELVRFSMRRGGKIETFHSQTLRRIFELVKGTPVPLNAFTMRARLFVSEDVLVFPVCSEVCVNLVTALLFSRSIQTVAWFSSFESRSHFCFPSEMLLPSF